jgi:Zn-dependent protease with chaperone function
MNEDCRPLTDAERERLVPLIEETDIPIEVTSTPTTFMETDERTIPLAGEASGYWPRERRVVLGEQCFEEFTDEELVGLLAHELGHQEGYHGLVLRGFKAVVVMLALPMLLGSLAGIMIGIGSARWLVVGGSLVGLGAVPVAAWLSSAALSRRLELAATRRGAQLLGETAPLEALYAPRADEAYGDWWAELLYPYPHPAAQLAALRDDDH